LTKKKTLETLWLRLKNMFLWENLSMWLTSMLLSMYARIKKELRLINYELFHE